MKNTPSFISLLEKGLKLSISNIWRNKFLSIATIFVIGIIIFIFNIILAVNFIASDALNDLSKKIDVVVYLKETTNINDVENIIEDLKQIEGVENVEYTSKEDALKQIEKTHPDITNAFIKYNLGNPLPASINITTVHPKYHEPIANFLQQDKYQIYLSNVIRGENGNNSILTSVSKNLMELTNFAQQIIFWIVIIFIIGGSLIIFNALQITIFNRKKEISIMKLVGASHWFIRFPFIIESIIYGLLSVGLSLFMLLILSQKIHITDSTLWSYYSAMEFYQIFLIELAATILLSMVSSSLAVHEYLQKNIHS